MYRFTTEELGEYGQRTYLLTIAVEPDPKAFDSFDPYVDAVEWCVIIHYPASTPAESDTQIARIDTRHGRVHFDRLFEPRKRKEWFPSNFSLEAAESLLVSNWQEYAWKFERNHEP